jgi:hypothetical protein
MANLVKIGHTFLNLDRVWCFEDRFVSDKVDEVVAREARHTPSPRERPTTADLVELAGRQPAGGHQH